MTTNTTPATCTHPDADALDTPACGEQQMWSCETLGGCGEVFYITKPHAVFKFTLHAPDCDRKHLPASWCGCASRKAAGCADCDKEFPHDVQHGPGVDVYN